MASPDTVSTIRLSNDVKLSPLLGRRLAAAGVDAALVAACCFALFLALSPLVETRKPSLTVPAGLLLGAMTLLEMITGRSPGKLLRGLKVTASNGARAALPTLIIRTLVKMLPPALFVLSLLVADQLAFLSLAGLSVFLLLCYVPPCYLLLLRTGRTMFDAVARTALAPAS